MGLRENTLKSYNYENMTINDLISDYIIYKIENPNFDFLKIKYWKIFNGKNTDPENYHITKVRRFTDDDFNFDLSIKDLILSPQYRHGTLNEDEENYDSDNNHRSKKHLPGRYIKPTTLREVSKGFELLQQYKIYL